MYPQIKIISRVQDKYIPILDRVVYTYESETYSKVKCIICCHKDTDLEDLMRGIIKTNYWRDQPSDCRISDILHSLDRKHWKRNVALSGE